MLSAPEIEELNDLTKHYYVMRDELKLVNEQVAELERAVNDLSARLTHLNDKNKQLNSRRSVILLAYFLEHFALYCLWFCDMRLIERMLFYGRVCHKRCY